MVLGKPCFHLVIIIKYLLIRLLFDICKFYVICGTVRNHGVDFTPCTDYFNTDSIFITQTRYELLR